MNTFFIRVIIYIIAMVLGLLYEFTRYQPYDGSAIRRENGTANRLRVLFRRRRAMKKCKEFVSKKKRVIILRNTNVVFAYDTEKKTFVCLNARNVKQSVSIEWIMQLKSAYEDLYDNTFERTFDNICNSFDEKTSYRGLVKVLKDNFDNVVELLQPSNEQIREEVHETQKALQQDTLINVNDASENALAQLPGIGIALAKKIVKRINTKGCYLSVEQMCKEMKIKEHFRIQLCDYLCAKPVIKEKQAPKNNNDRKNNDDRIIDL